MNKNASESSRQQLLELAAKAAELPECGWMGPAFMYVKDNQFTDWDPLTDDGDALRLAVRLGLTINPYKRGIFVSRYEGEPVITEEWSEDAYAATRRAIVRAAAAIAKATGGAA